MPTTELRPIVAAIGRFTRDQRKTVTGIAIGGLVTLALTAVGATAPTNTIGSASSTLISQQSSQVAESLKQQAEDCANGGQGSIGGSIKDAMGIHQRLAMTPVPVDKLFSVSNDCFSGLSQIYDLSFSIPSLSSILNSAANAVMQYAQKKVCSAVNEVTGMVTSPINEAIAEINASGKLGDLNGLTNGLVQSGLSSLDPALGSSYSGSPAGSTYTVNTNPFNQSQTSFDNSGTGTSTGSTGTTTNIGNTNATINALNTQIANTQAQVMPAQMALNTAQQQLASCQAYDYNNCTGYEQQVASAQTALNAVNQQLATLLQQLSGVAGSSATTASSSAQGVTQQSSSGNWIDSIGNLFN